jgi:hypothetical protein
MLPLADWSPSHRACVTAAVFRARCRELSLAYLLVTSEVAGTDRAEQLVSPAEIRAGIDSSCSDNIRNGPTDVMPNAGASAHNRQTLTSLEGLGLLDAE